MTAPPYRDSDGTELGDLTAVNRADVYKRGQLAAHLERTPSGVRFAYTTDWVDSAGAPVATTLPVTAEAVVGTGGAVPAYFAGLLPEGRRLGALRRSVKTSADDELSLVLAVGSDVIGDVQIVPSGQPPSRTPARFQVEDFAAVRFHDLLETLDIDIDRVGLPGVQDKVSLTMLNLPITAAGGEHILKLNPPEYPNVVENEHFFLAAAKSTGIETAKADLVHDADKEAGLVVRRFDRLRLDGVEQALAVEDGCQALGLHPEAKYRIRTEDLLVKLCSMCDAPLVAARVFLAQIAFAYLTGNGDAHAKNFSVLQDQYGQWGPAPAYDVPSSQPYGDTTMALSLTGTRDGNVPGQRFVDLGRQLGLPERAARRTIDRVAGAVDDWIDGIDVLPFNAGRRRKLIRVILHRRQMLVRGY